MNVTRQNYYIARLFSMDKLWCIYRKIHHMEGELPPPPRVVVMVLLLPTKHPTNSSFNNHYPLPLNLTYI